MKTKCMKFSLVLLLFVGAALITMAVPVQATFMVDGDPGGDFFYINGANKDVSTFYGSVGANLDREDVDVTTVGNVDTGNGYATIKAVQGGVLTNLIFTPAGDNKYGDFSFRGQLEEAGQVQVIVTDQLDAVFTFVFDIANANQDFARIGVSSPDGEWIKSVEIMGDFFEVKQINFSPATPVPVPEALLLLGSGLLGLLGLKRR